MIGIRRKLRGRWLGALTIVAAILTTACHTYTPVENPAPGATVRVQIPVRSALDDPNAPPRTTSIQGRVFDNGDTLGLAITNRMEFGAFREVVQHDTLRLAPDQYYGLEVREFSRGRTIVLGAVLTGVVVGAAAVAFGFGGGEGGEEPPGGRPEPAVVGSLISGLLGLVFGN